MNNSYLINNGSIVNRNEAESNFLYTQLVSYTLIFYPEKQKAFIAQRISGDSRLLGSYCLGFGGHVSIDDINGKYSKNPIVNAAIRELREELVLKNKVLNPSLIGYVRDVKSNTSEHLGAIFILELGSAFIKETKKLKGFWISYNDLKNKYYDKLESWSKYALDFVYEDPILRNKLRFKTE